MDPKQRSWRDLPASVIAMLGLAVLMTLISYMSKTPCSGPPYNEAGYSTHMADSYRLVCLTDIQELWTGRGIDVHKFPYVHGRLEPAAGQPGNLVDGAIEYPVLTGLFMWFTGLPAANSGQYLGWTALLLLPVALAIGWQLGRLVGWRALIWGAAPALIFYSVYNWDLLPVVWVLGAVLAWRRERHWLAGVCLGLGAATKIYPGFFVLPLIIERWIAGDRRGALLTGGSAAGAWLAVNLPFMAANFDGWWATYAFQADRVPDESTNSIYFWGFPHWSLQTVDTFSIIMIISCWVLALFLGFYARERSRELPGVRSTRERSRELPGVPSARSAAGKYPWIQVSAAMLFAFLAFNKVYSPQYFLWVLPFLALIRLRWGWWVAYWCIDVVLFIGLIRWYHDGSDLARQMASLGGWTKSVLLMLLFFAVLRTPLADGVNPPPAEARATAPRQRGADRPARAANRPRLSGSR